jgi:hypothetical protein
MLDANAVCGVKESPIFDAIDIDHYVMPGLDMLIGKGYGSLDNLMAEVQAAAEKTSLRRRILLYKKILHS